MYANGDPASISLPSNAKILSLDGTLSAGTGIQNTGRLIYCLAREVFAAKSLKLIKNIRYHVSELRKYMAYSLRLFSFLKKNKLIGPEFVYYSFWTDEWASILSILKEERLPDMLIVSRAHGFDVYSERREHGYIFPRHLQLLNISKIFAISQNACDYLQKHHPQFKSKISLSRLGTPEPRFPKRDSPHTDPLRIVSCSNVTNIKRVQKIPGILAHCKRSIEWVHFGEGELMDDLRNDIKKLPNNIKVHLMGTMSNEVVLKYYSETSIDWFMNVSNHEGIPVSMMEAISYGIPIVGTDVGGVNEIVTPETGVLIPRDFNSVEVAVKIENIFFDIAGRRRIVDFWRKNFSAKVNYHEFAQKIISLTTAN
jgi:glycosyltransferase involved in cell wall biosynthesis